MFDSLKRMFRTPPSHDHWDSPEIWKDVPQTRFEAPRAKKRPKFNQPDFYL